jgi:signal transduction histidine kinase
MRKILSGGSAAISPEKAESLMVVADKQILRLARLVDDMLDISRISAGKMFINPAPMDLSEHVSGILKRFAPHFEAAHVSLETEIQEGVTGKWDAARLEQVLDNLLTNALKYGKKNPVLVSLSASQTEARLIVSDQGIGISEENLPRLFHRFERAVPAGTISGLGLGLYIVQRIIDLHEGRIDVRSQVGKGTSFTVHLLRSPTS